MYEDNQATDGGTLSDADHTEWSSIENLTTSLLAAVADETGTDVSDLPPLNDAIDPDALESILSRDRDDVVQLSFNYAGVRVQIDSDGYLFAQRRTDPAE